jgi:DNA-binding transcriptional regulator YiaG
MAATTKKKANAPARSQSAPSRAARPVVERRPAVERAVTMPGVLWGGSLSIPRGAPAAFEVVTLEEPAAPENEQAIAERLVDTAADASDVKRLCETYGLRREDLGRLTGFSLRALADWSAGKLPSEPAKRRLHEIRRLLDALADVVKVEAIPAWLKTRNPAFENMTPIQVIEVGEIDRLWQMVYAMGSDSLD